MEKLDYLQFFDYVWGEYVSEKIVTDEYFEKNEKLIQGITYDFHIVYEKTPNGSETHFAKLIEMVFKNIIAFNGIYNKEENIVNDAYEYFED